MIVQTAAPGEPHFIVTQIDHARMSGDLASAFGNEQFVRPEPWELITYVIAHHDEGWVEVDAAPARDLHTGLVYHLTRTPLADLMTTSRRSPDFNERRHPFCGILSSMHSWGLYNGRYGLSDKIFIDSIDSAQRPAVHAMLDAELSRQERLKQALRDDPATAEWVDDALLFQAYKLLQFFDTLALYFQTTHAAARTPSRFLNVPAARNCDVILEVTPVAPDVAAVTPWPFAGARLEVRCPGKMLTPQPEGVDMSALLAALPLTEQRYTLIPG